MVVHEAVGEAEPRVPLDRSLAEQRAGTRADPGRRRRSGARRCRARTRGRGRLRRALEACGARTPIGGRPILAPGGVRPLTSFHRIKGSDPLLHVRLQKGVRPLYVGGGASGGSLVRACWWSWMRSPGSWPTRRAGRRRCCRSRGCAGWRRGSGCRSWPWRRGRSGRGTTDARVLARLPEGAPVIEKPTFGLCGCAAAVEAISATGRRDGGARRASRPTCASRSRPSGCSTSAIRAVVAEDAAYTTSDRDHDRGMARMTAAGVEPQPRQGA